MRIGYWKRLLFNIVKNQTMAGLRRKPSERKYPGFSQEKEGKWRGAFYFIQGADTQFGLKDSWTKVPEDDRSWAEELELTRKAIKAVNNARPRPRFFIVCGDMIDAFPGKKHYEEQLKDFQLAFQELDEEIPLLCVCGNHDVGNRPTAEDISSYKSKYGDDYYSFWVGGVFFIVLNSQYYKDGSMVQDLKKQHETWLEEQLRTAKTAKHSVIFQHIPWFLKDANEPDDYFNITKTVRIDVLQKFKEAGVKYVFAGHYHRNAGGFDGDLEMVVTSAIGFPLGDDKPGMRVVTVKSEEIVHSFEDLETFPKEISLE